jgi:O-antigen/teichoic acid export membrane protein
LYKKITHSFAWDFIGKISNQLVTLIIGIVLARLLSPREYGLIGMSMIFIGFSEIFTNLGLSTALIQKKNPTEDHFSSSFYLNIVSALVLVGLFVFVAPYIASFYNTPQITPLIRILSLSMLISSFSIVQEARLRREINFKLLSIGKFISSIVAGLIGVILALKGFGVWSLVVQTLLSRFLVGSYFWYKSTWKPKLIFKLNAIKELWSYSMRMFVSGIINTAYEQLDSILIGKLFSITDLGLYSRAKSLNRFVISYSSESVGNVMFPVMSSLNDEREKLVQLGMKTESLVAFISWGLLGFLFVTAEPLFLVLFGQKWIAAIPVYKILCLSGFAYPISAATLSMLKASGDSKTFLKLEVYKKIGGLFFMLAGLYIGFNAYLYALILIGLFATTLNMYYVSKSLEIGFWVQFYESFSYLVPSAIAVVTSLLVIQYFQNNYLILIISTISFFGTYLVINYTVKSKGLLLALQRIPKRK